MRIVLDTNVVLSALLWRGTPYRLLSTIRQHEHVELFSSPALLTELGDVLTRPVPTARLALLGRTAHEVLREHADAAELVIPAAVPPVVVAYSDDDQVIVAAGRPKRISSSPATAIRWRWAGTTHSTW